MQTKTMSFVETLSNTAIGFLISVLTTAVVLPQYQCPVTMIQNVEITTIFTVVSIVRGYILRRFFNGYDSWLTNSGRQRGLLKKLLRDEVMSDG